MVDLSGANLRNVDLVGANIYRADLSHADLQGAYLIGASLDWTILTDANLSDADLFGAELEYVELTRADLRRADLRRTVLRGVFLRDAKLHEADLRSAVIQSSDLTGATFDRATVGDTVFADTDLSRARGLETVEHWRASTIGVDTILLSGAPLPKSFLEGCGVPDDPAALLGTGEPAAYYSCFISYSSADAAFAEQLRGNLRERGVRSWFAPSDMKSGDRIRPTIDHAIRSNDKLLVVLSARSIASDWVADEVETALEEERQRDVTMLFPIRLDDTVMHTQEAWAAMLRRTRHIGDFRRWRESAAYEVAFQRLLRDLRRAVGDAHRNEGA